MKKALTIMAVLMLLSLGLAQTFAEQAVEEADKNADTQTEKVEKNETDATSTSSRNLFSLKVDPEDYKDPANPLAADNVLRYAAGQKYFNPPKGFFYDLEGLPDPILGHGVLFPAFKKWYQLRKEIEEEVGFHTNFSYTTWSQWASKTHSVPGKSTPDCMTNGRLDLLGYWELPKNALGTSRINFLARQGTNYGWSTGTTLDTSIGDISGVNGGYNPSISMNVLSYEQELLDGKVSFQIGKIHSGWYMFVNPVADDETSQFINGSLDGNPGWAIGNYAPGAILRIHEFFHKDFYLYGSVVNMTDNITTAMGGLDEGKWAGVAEFGWKPKFGPDKLQGHYRFNYWYSDNSKFGSRSGSGMGLNFDQEIMRNLILFLTYAFNPKDTFTQEHQLAGGFGILEPFKRRGEMFGVGGSWCRASENQANEYVLETFYRFQLTDAIQISPDMQMIFNPAEAPEKDVCVVLGLRFKFQF